MQVITLFAALSRRAAVVWPAAASAASSPRALVQQGMDAFSEARIEESILAFDAAAKLEPKLATRLWQRGLSLYYANRFEDAAAQFASDVAENPNDTEESIWNYLALARARGPRSARKQLIVISGERRPVMRLVYAMVETGDEAEVAAVATSGTAAPIDRFYAALYLGLYAEAQGDARASEGWIDTALHTSDFSYSRDYMLALAKVHAKLRRKL
ncbi:hypothetical protein CTAYLR_007639 [Chrysophaeum taylorii]|uniref:Uncharacterized protein n=1 Tax=Chrysophaeum taylorii TaxID=2483200 RepID=A0AAD7UFD0_9STRA|nr:hypothetical protein CTAYLR_007639 [Chrysophaeum taylorii]